MEIACVYQTQYMSVNKSMNFTSTTPSRWAFLRTLFEKCHPGHFELVHSPHGVPHGLAMAVSKNSSKYLKRTKIPKNISPMFTKTALLN